MNHDEYLVGSGIKKHVILPSDRDEITNTLMRVVLDTKKEQKLVVGGILREVETITHYSLDWQPTEEENHTLQFFLLSHEGKEVYFRLYRTIRQNLTNYYCKAEIFTCPLSRCYSFVWFVLTGALPFCNQPHCKHKLKDAEQLEQLANEHLAKNFVCKEVSTFDIGDVVCFKRSIGKKYHFEHFGIDFGPHKNCERLCLSKMGTYDNLFLTTHTELHRLYGTDGRLWKLTLKAKD